MKDQLLLGVGYTMVPIPQIVWAKHVVDGARHNQESLAFMGDDHHQVRNYVVKELPFAGTALSPEKIATDLGLPRERVITLLDELEKHMTFLFRNEQGEVAWAYPVTVEPTPHTVTFNSGEKLYAA
jgi:hypothetical protein